MTSLFNHRTRRKLIGLIFLGLALRVVMPVGYMPAPIGEGGPFVLCPDGVFGASLVISSGHQQGGGEHHHAGHAGDEGPNAWEFCPFGAVTGSAVLASFSDLPALPPAAIQPSAAVADMLPAVRRAAFHARAPPTPIARHA